MYPGDPGRYDPNCPILAPLCGGYPGQLRYCEPKYRTSATATASANTRQATVAQSRVAAEPPRPKVTSARCCGGSNAGASPAAGVGRTARMADGGFSGGAGTSP